MTSVVDGRVVLEDGQPTGLEWERSLTALEARIPDWRGKLAALGSRSVFGRGCACC